MTKINVKRYENFEFKLLGKIEYFLEYIDIYVFSSFPKSDRPLKDLLNKSIYDLLNNCSLANFNTGSIRNKYQKQMLSNMVSIDYCFGLLLDKGIVKTSRFYTLCSLLNEIKNMTYGWINEK